MKYELDNPNSYNNISSTDSLNELLSQLDNNSPHIISLNVKNDVLNFGIAYRIFNAMSQNNRLRQLQLHMKYMKSSKFILPREKDQMLVGFWQSLKNNTTLEYLSLTNFPVQHDKYLTKNVPAICELLNTNRSLIMLCINENGINDDGAKEIICALENNFTLTKLEIRNAEQFAQGTEKITAESFEQIEAIMQRNRRLRDQFVFAASQGDMITIQQLATKGVSINNPAENNMTALHLAAKGAFRGSTMANFTRCKNRRKY